MATRKRAVKQEPSISAQQQYSIPDQFADVLRELRVSSGLSHRQLAEKVGVNTTTVSDWENGISLPDNDETISRLSKILDTNLFNIIEKAKSVEIPDLDLREDMNSGQKNEVQLTPELPRDSVKIERGGTEIIVGLVDNIWRLPVDSMLMPIYTDGENNLLDYTGSWRNLEKELSPQTIKEITDIRYRHLSANTKRLKFYPLSSESAAEGFPFTDPEHGGLFLVSYTSTEFNELMFYFKATLDEITGIAGDNNITRIVLPAIRPAPETLKDPPVNVFRSFLNVVLSHTDFGGINKIYIPAGSDEEITAAYQQFNRFNNNRPQKIWSDEPTDNDLLGIKDEVDALAETLLLRDVVPPVSVGIIGGWGSGKSTVMKLMQKRMTALRLQKMTRGWEGDGDNGKGKDKDKGKLSEHVGHVYQIQFNAWTYAKSNLWASLMQKIFCDLNRQLSIEKKLSEIYPIKDGGEIYTHLYDEKNPRIKTADGKYIAISIDDENPLWDTMRERKKSQIVELQAVEKEIADLKVKRDKQLTAYQDTVLEQIAEKGFKAAVDILKKKIKAQSADNLSKASKELLDDEKVLDETQVEQLFGELRSFKSLAVKVWAESKKSKLKRGLSALAILLIPVGIIIPVLIDTDVAARIVTGIASCLPVSTALLKLILQSNKRTNELIHEHQNIVETEQANRQSMKDALLKHYLDLDEQAIAQAEDKSILDEEKTKDKLHQLTEKGNLAAINSLLASLETRKEELKREAGPAASYTSLLDFVKARQDEQYYEKSLGLMHQVKNDIDQLTDGLVLDSKFDTEEVKAAKKELFPRGQARIILYIDDLDRCPPSRVIEVLEAVQLLLNTRLFVVVLGLDTRYVTRALEKEYSGILRHEGDPSGLDYIEKIIQIPYRVRPISPEDLTTFLESQMEIYEDTEVSSQDTGTTSPVTGTTADIQSSPGDEEKFNIPPETQEQTQREELPTEVIKFSTDDLTDLNACCGQINLTPRSVKRLVNVLKLIKIFWFRDLGEDRPRKIKQAIIALLALSAGYPMVMREVFAQLGTKYRDQKTISNKKIATYIRSLKPPESQWSPQSWQYDQFFADVTALTQKDVGTGNEKVNYLDVTLRELDLKTFNLVRSFSFVGDPTHEIEENQPGPEQK